MYFSPVDYLRVKVLPIFLCHVFKGLQPSKTIYLKTHDDGWDVQVSVSNGRQRGFRSRGPVFCEKNYTTYTSARVTASSKLE